jgi:Ca2+-binding EF-hand superfamily protein
MFRARNKCTQNQQTPSDNQVRKQAVEQISRRNACAIAASSVALILASADSPHSIVGLSRQMIELRKWMLQAEVDILDLLRAMDNFDRMETLFEMFDKDDSGEVSLDELERALKKVDFHQALHDCIAQALTNFDSRNGQMEFNEFSNFVDDLKEAVDWSFEEVTEFLAIHVGFADGAVLLDEGVDMLLGSSSLLLGDDFSSAVMEVRLIYLFQMFDPLGKGLVEFEDVVKSLYGLTREMDQVTREVLMMCSSERRELSYDRFSQFMYDVVSAGGYDFDTIANGMTLSMFKQDVSRKDLGQLFHGMVSGEAYVESAETKDIEVDDPVVVGRADRYERRIE